MNLAQERDVVEFGYADQTVDVGGVIIRREEGHGGKIGQDGPVCP